MGFCGKGFCDGRRKLRFREDRRGRGVRLGRHLSERGVLIPAIKPLEMGNGLGYAAMNLPLCLLDLPLPPP
jgi:hypothetical protein